MCVCVCLCACISYRQMLTKSDLNILNVRCLGWLPYSNIVLKVLFTAVTHWFDLCVPYFLHIQPPDAIPIGCDCLNYTLWCCINLLHATHVDAIHVLQHYCSTYCFMFHV